MLSLLRRSAQGIRHHKSLQFLNPLWSLLRAPYLKVMTLMGRKRGIEVEIAGCGIRLHPIFCTQRWETIEADTYRAFVAAVPPGGVVYDIGAHIGTYTILALKKAGPNGRVVAYEPHEYTREHFQLHLRWNGVDARTTVRDVCCGAAAGTADFYFIPGQAEGMNGLVPVQGFQKRTMKVVSLDQEVADLAVMPDIIKIDVEGAEWDVLKGAEQTLKQKHPVLFLSLHPSALAKRSESPEAILDWLKQRGYNCEIGAQDHETHVIARGNKEKPL